MYREFLKRFFPVSLIGLILMASFHYVIDPFGVYFSQPIKGLNDFKVELDNRFTVASKIISYKPKTISFGTSRIAAGLDGDVLREYSQNEPYFNAGFSGAGFDEIYAYFLHALHIQPDLKTVILGIDLFSFGEARKPQVDFCEERLMKNFLTLKDTKYSLLSSKALSRSLECIYRSVTKIPADNVIIKMGDKTFLKALVNSKDYYHDFKIDPDKIQKFRSLVDICRENSIDLKVFTCPVRVVYWEVYWENGLWPQVEDLKRQLCAIHPLWDFTGYNPITTETLDMDGKPLYHECSHFSHHVGGLLMKRMYGLPSPIDTIGYLLTPETVESDFAKILSHRYLWLENSRVD